MSVAFLRYSIINFTDGGTSLNPNSVVIDVYVDNLKCSDFQVENVRSLEVVLEGGE